MIVPAPRLLWIVAAAGLPAAVASALLPGAIIPASILAVIVAFAAIGDAILSRHSLAGVAIELPNSQRCYKDRPANLTMRIDSAEAIERMRAGIAWPPELTVPYQEQWIALPAGSFTLDWPFTATRRGEHRLELAALERTSRFGLWEIRREIPLRCAIQSLPTLQTVEDLLAFRQQTTGGHAVRQIGKGRDFEKLREYLPGDGFDEIHWKATARRAKPITKVFQVERTREIYAIVDGSRLTGRMAGGDTRLERYVSACLVLAGAATRNGDLFGVVTFQDRVLDFVRAGKGAAHNATCRQALSRIAAKPLAPDFQEAATEIRLQLRGRALLLFLTDLDDPSTAEAFTNASRLLAARHVVTAATIRPPHAQPLFSTEPAAIDDIYAEVGGHLAWRSMKELEVRLRQQGIRFGAFEEKSFSRQVAELYQETKARQLI